MSRLATCACALILTATPVSPLTIDREWPGTYYEIPGVNPIALRFWLPDDVEVFRGIYVWDPASGDSAGYLNTCVARAWEYCIVQYRDDPGRFYPGVSPVSASTVYDAMQTVARISGHPEIPNLPMIWPNGQWGADHIVGSFGPRVIAYRWWNDNAHSGSIPRIKCAEEGATRKPVGGFEFLVDAIAPFRAEDEPVASAPQWGWGHGQYSMRDVILPFCEQSARMRVPASWNPRSGLVSLRDCPPESTWLGDGASWYDEWPTIAPQAEYTGDVGRAIWLPNRDAAFVWRAYVTRHPTKELREQGKGHVGSAASTWECSGEPEVWTVSPAVSYDVGVLPPVVHQDTVVRVEMRTNYRTIEKIELFDGSRLVAEKPGNAYNVYLAQTRLSVPGMRSLIVIATYTDSTGTTRKACSRPASIIVIRRDPSPVRLSVTAAPSHSASPFSRGGLSVLGRAGIRDGTSANRYTCSGRTLTVAGRRAFVPVALRLAHR